ncbi:olfactory receptor class A-like protein 1 [Xenopus tropicalis]|uniref:Vomeronasal type-1 receptor n=1 Tax=Xenopus tropicalis TaxID=8364 RepID=A0A8J0SDX5_XENTR|nr:olfactory receptor class A-like protein 1 [Xenopus tropicalis]|eukprot:XP_012811351.1 PREDICTED: vomeronasal type-1 receptor 45-like [Xenopus tropicalis]
MNILLYIKAVGFFLLAAIGIPGNMYILFKFVKIKVTIKKLLATNSILMVLASMNLLIVFSRINLQFLNAIGVENFLDDSKCKFFVYTYRVGRAMSICTTSLLSCYQCIIIAPQTRLWAYLRQKAMQNVLLITTAVLIANLILYRNTIMYAIVKKNSTTSPYTLHLVYCDMDYLTYEAYILNGGIFASMDFLFVGLMTVASIYIVYVLLCHEKSIKGKRSTDRVPGKSVEYKASRAVIMLVILYVILFGFDNSMWIYTLTLSNVTPDMNDARIALTCSYSALSPIVIIATNPKLQQLLTFLKRRKCFFCYRSAKGKDIQVHNIDI